MPAKPLSDHKLNLKIKGLPKGVTAVIHFHPVAYCVAKPAPHCAVFVIAPQKNRFTKDLYAESCLIANPSVENTKPGDWNSIAYVIFGAHHSENIAVPYQPNPPTKAPTKEKVGRRSNLKA